MAPTSTTTSTVGQTTSTPSVRKAGTYQLHCEATPAVNAGTGKPVAIAYCHAYRNGVLLTTVRAADRATAVREARRNVRNARKAGGL